MAKREYVYAECYSEIFRFTKKQWRQYLLEFYATEGDAYPNQHGKSLLVVDHDITDINMDQVKFLLDNMREAKDDGQTTSDQGS